MPSLLRSPAILACAAFLSCGGPGGGSDGPPIPPGPVTVFRCEGSPPAADHVALACAGQIDEDEWLIDVVPGVSSASNINGFDFDVTFDPLNLAYVPGSAMEGNLLNRDGAQVLLAAALDPADPGRLIVGIYRTGGTGISGLTGQERIMSFRFKALTATPFGPLVPHFENARAADSSRQDIPEIKFSDQVLLSVE